MSEISATKKSATASLSLAALGIVYGDIGTSPLYAMRESLFGLPVTDINVLGILSLIFWSLILVISLKYLVILLRADNNGEGGILALLALVKRYVKKKETLLLVLGMFGAGLIWGDGMLTPAISVISALEGLHIVFPAMGEWVLPITIIILLALFSVQAMGTAKIGFFFGPIILLWFITIGALGLLQIIHTPIVLKAINPYYAVKFFINNGMSGYALLGGVFLVITGGEALYADLGHFGKVPIRIGWFAVALPCLLLNYFGQGAYLLVNPYAIINPFYLIAPKWFTFPLLILATVSTIIASQAVISATFSLTRQAILLGLFPHLPIVQTSDLRGGQIYIPQMNVMLAIGTLLLVVTFKNSNALTHAYGIAVNLDMVLTTVLLGFLASRKWHWNKFLLGLFFVFIAIIDFAFLGANLQKLLTGGWVPIVFATSCAFIMFTWYKGRLYLKENYYVKKDEFKKMLHDLDYAKLQRLRDTTAVFITDIYDKSGGSFLHFLRMNKSIPEHALIINYIVENVPYVSSLKRFEINKLSKNICELTLHYGFMDTISIPQALYLANDMGILPFEIQIEDITYLIEIPHVVVTKKQKVLSFFWQERIFAFLVRNYSANLNIEFYQLPYNRTMAVGTYYLI